MDIEQSVDTLEALANGVDPASGELIPANSPYNSPVVVRALFACLEQLRNPKRGTRMTLEQRQADNLKRGVPRNAGTPWTEEIKLELAQQFAEGKKASAMACHFERSLGSIVHELKKQGLISEEEARALR